MSLRHFRNFRSAIVAGLIVAALLASGHSFAQSVSAYASVNLNQRAGPGTRFPIIATAPVGTPVTLFGCLGDLSWCDGAYQGNRGWFSARYLQLWYQGNYLTVANYVRYAYLPIVSFNISSYWANYYPTRPFYAELSLYASSGSVTVSIGSFYEPLSPLGSWVLIHERYVWVPRVAANWRPYTDGRWAYTRTQGWMWVSNEPFGWATYHYGRWAYSPTIGWFWVPGTRWAPAWVAWRQSDDYLAWAPLPPDPKELLGISVDISFGNIPNYYWQAVPARDFQAPNLTTVVIGDNNQVTNIVNQTQSIGNVTIVNNVVVNNVVNVEYVEEKTQQKVTAYNVALTPDADKSGKVEGDTIDVFHPPAAELPPAEQPPTVAPVEKVAAESKTAGQSGSEATTEDLVPPPPPPDATPPPAEAPPMVGAEPPATEEPAAPVEQPPPVLAGAPPCGEGTVRQEDGTCAAPPASPPPAEEVTPQAPAAKSAPPPPPPTEAAPVLPPAPPAEPAQAPPLAPPAAPVPAPPVPPAAAQPAPAPTPAPAAAPPVPPPETQPAPAPAPPPAPPAEAQPAPGPEPAPAPPAELGPAPLPSQLQQPPPCPEGYVANNEGVCVLPQPQ